MIAMLERWAAGLRVKALFIYHETERRYGREDMQALRRRRAAQRRRHA